MLTEIDEYQLCLDRGFNPLSPKKHDFAIHFELDIKLRVTIQKQFFGHTILGRGDIPKANERFYRYMWENKPHYCEECMKPLKNYWSGWVSHILSRGGFPEMAHDTRNANILCEKHHSQWETGNRKTMRIYRPNLVIIEKLTKEYQSLR